ncbi:MAG: NADH-quinone oxidoreductase subunit A [Planctomycetales bacterium]|nr:NADH-quinone oxidoreductase subunit A [Planctomycetales bacterium]MCA9162800.1 NADH-quinone oxidoreductase subunit A [Planctomycetales bacterium]MCA9206924.1 NADH-quinone oxidoreductase subunit A [Planctomycetales bacterium]MCA9222565.1 NADH-quinone oxidoreductase subunit A [Planctomycetales bacterium]MCA9225240.1 NADH-quinone oxidoreductase subunit A [Planctomycetales bacterium]
MSPAVESSLSIVAYLAIFSSVGLLFLFANLLVGRFVRPDDPNPEKLEIYECGEPTIGSSFVQFDLRFYVVALLFIIFDVEVAFFFPWAVVFGKSTHLMDERATAAVVEEVDRQPVLTAEGAALYRELGVRNPQIVTQVPATLDVAPGNDAVTADEIARAGAKQIVLLTLFDIGAFFAILMVGFAYVWRRGDLDWVRSITRQRTKSDVRVASFDDELDEEPVLSA